MTSLTNGKNYTCTVTARNLVGTSDPSVPVSVYVSNDTIAPEVGDNRPGGIYTGAQSVTLTADEPATIYYTLDGSLPNAFSTVYTGPITIATSKVLRYFAKDLAGNSSAVASQAYTIRLVDLVMETVSKVATSVPAGGSFAITSVELNQGATNMTVTSNMVRFYLSTDATISTTDILLIGSRTVSALAGLASSASASTTVTVPGAVTPLVYYVGACADMTNVQPETVETNNCTAAGTITVVREVDLIMDTVSKTAADVHVGKTFAVGSIEKNQGTTKMTVSSNAVRFYLSADATITTADILLAGGSRTVSVLAGGAISTTGSTIVTVPKTVAPGTYYVGACADATNVQSETDETNNCMAAAGTILVIREVDLVMELVTNNATSAHVGSTFTINNIEKNQGATNMTASSNAVRFYLSTDATITTADILLAGSRTISALASGFSSTDVATTVTVPKTVAPGTYTVGVCADATNVQPETSDSNNCMAAVATITVIRDVDLVMTGVGTAAEFVPLGGSFTISNTELNQGTTNMTVSSNIVRFYLSTDATITTADRLIGSRPVSALAAGASSTVPISVTVSLSMAPGTYYIGAIADASGVQPEANETNNTNSPSVVTIVVY